MKVEYILTDIEECLNDLKLLFPFVSICWAMNQKKDDSIIREAVQFFVDKKSEEIKNKQAKR